MQEVMSLDRSEFSTSIIDIDSIAFSLSKIQDVAQKYLEPEPYQGDKQPEEVSENNIGGVSVNSGGGGGSLWQNLGNRYFILNHGVKVDHTYFVKSWVMFNCPLKPDNVDNDLNKVVGTNFYQSKCDNFFQF